MDPTGILDAVLAVAVYPGAAFLVLAALLHRTLAGTRWAFDAPSGGLPARTLLPVIAAVVGVAMLPLPGSPALRLPPNGGTATNVIAVIVLLAIATDLGARSRRAAAFGAAAALVVMALAATAATTSASTIVAMDSALAIGARAVAAALLLLAAATSGPSRSSSLVAAALGLAAAGLVVPAATAALNPLLGALASLGVVALAGLLARAGWPWAARAVPVAALCGAACGTALALLASRA